MQKLRNLRRRAALCTKRKVLVCVVTWTLLTTLTCLPLLPLLDPYLESLQEDLDARNRERALCNCTPCNCILSELFLAKLNKSKRRDLDDRFLPKVIQDSTLDLDLKDVDI